MRRNGSTVAYGILQAGDRGVGWWPQICIGDPKSVLGGQGKHRGAPDGGRDERSRHRTELFRENETMRNNYWIEDRIERIELFRHGTNSFREKKRIGTINCSAKQETRRNNSGGEMAAKKSERATKWGLLPQEDRGTGGGGVRRAWWVESCWWRMMLKLEQKGGSEWTCIIVIEQLFYNVKLFNLKNFRRGESGCG